MPLWGQFVNRDGTVKESDECFRLPVLTAEAPAREFYEFYGI